MAPRLKQFPRCHDTPNFFLFCFAKALSRNDQMPGYSPRRSARRYRHYKASDGLAVAFPRGSSGRHTTSPISSSTPLAQRRRKCTAQRCLVRSCHQAMETAGRDRTAQSPSGSPFRSAMLSCRSSPISNSTCCLGRDRRPGRTCRLGCCSADRTCRTESGSPDRVRSIQGSYHSSPISSSRGRPGSCRYGYRIGVWEDINSKERRVPIRK